MPSRRTLTSGKRGFGRFWCDLVDAATRAPAACPPTDPNFTSPLTCGKDSNFTVLAEDFGSDEPINRSSANPTPHRASSLAARFHRGQDLKRLASEAGHE